MEMPGGGGPFGSPWHTPPRVLENLGAGTVMGMDACGLLELQDSTFEPQTRARSNTWPLPRPENYVEPGDGSDSNKCSNQQLAMSGEFSTHKYFEFSLLTLILDNEMVSNLGNGNLRLLLLMISLEIAFTEFISYKLY